MFDLIIVGSGAAGTFAAFAAARTNLRILMLDVGRPAPAGKRLGPDFLTLRQSDPQQSSYFIGAKFESLHNISEAYLSPKLKAPRFRFVTDQADALSPLAAHGFSPVQSLAYGGLANAWGAGTFEYTAEDLAGFPFALTELRAHYQELVSEIGISGTSDDLAYHFGSTEGLQPPHRLDRLSSRLLAGYERRRASFQERGFTIGRPRLALLSQDLRERTACNYDNLAFWEPQIPYLYTPRFTLDRLIRDGRESVKPALMISIMNVRSDCFSYSRTI